MDRHYWQHLCKVRNARCEVDSRPPNIRAEIFFRPTRIRHDNDCSKRIISENVVLLEKMNQIQRIEGEVKCYNKNSGIRKTNIAEKKKLLQKIDEENFNLGRKLFCMKATFNTRPPAMKHVPRTPHDQIEYRKELYKQYEDVMPVRDINRVPLLLWPKIYIDLEIKGYRCLDRIVMVLCTEAAPNVVLHLVRMCKEGKSLFKFNRIFPNLWTEGEIETPEGLEIGTTQKINPHIDHSQSGTLNLLERGAKGCFEFSLSFKPLKVLNGKSVAFGKVMEGLKVLDCLQDYGTKNGKPKKEILVKNCGLVK
ncbi:uncharacterized protein LOC129941377 [Eupeodes corollae]|uniref:uncharacterized protein LOC129941377 n=1 Tax=Eupeodes corollae TaxID=290404 RepID=UPI00248F99CC|nr:uncharacterized protein LOC129941377 [Eupeodes corollae]